MTSDDGDDDDTGALTAASEPPDDCSPSAVARVSGPSGDDTRRPASSVRANLRWSTVRPQEGAGCKHDELPHPRPQARRPRKNLEPTREAAATPCRRKQLCAIRIGRRSGKVESQKRKASPSPRNHLRVAFARSTQRACFSTIILDRTTPPNPLRKW